ncbi:MAG TPA: hypothetical protein VIC26_00475 [Marinagarivorans sp.]
MVKSLYSFLVGTVCWLLLAFPGVASDDFDAGSRRFSLVAGSASALNDTYTVIGLGVGYYPVDGLELGIESNLWLGGDYDIYELSPSVTYVFTQLEAFKPYVGVLYRETFIEKQENLSAVGGRVGVVIQQGGNVSFRAGVVVVNYQDCQSLRKDDCTEVTPEFSLGVAF